VLAEQVQKGLLQPDQINEALFERHLYTAGICDPDLLIRTSGEMRISNFSLANGLCGNLHNRDSVAHFDRSEFHQALCSYQQRERRFGSEVGVRGRGQGSGKESYS